jgi:hypothetical protein
LERASLRNEGEIHLRRGYASIDIGMLTSAPYFARQLAELLP